METKASSEPSLWQSFRDSLLRPRYYFSSLSPLGPLGPALWFAILLSILSAAGLALNDFLFPLGTAIWPEPDPWYWNLLDWPLYLALGYLWLAWYNTVLRWRGGTDFPYRASFRAYSYASAPAIFSLIPWIGPWVALAWGLVLAFYAIKTIQRTSWTKVITSFLIANTLLVFALMLLVFVAGYFWHYFQ